MVGSCRYSGGQVRHRQRGDVGRIADDEVVALAGQVREQVGADQVDAVGERIVGDVALGDRERVGRDVDRVDVGVRICVREQDRETARPRAQIERGTHGLRRSHVRCEAVGHELGDERARDQHALVDVKAERAEPGLARQVRRRHPLVDAALEQLRELCSLGLCKPRVQKWLQPVEREVQGMEEQISRLVVGVGHPVPECELRLAEARDRIAQPVAQRDEIVSNRAHECAPTLAAAAAVAPRDGPATFKDGSRPRAAARGSPRRSRTTRRDRRCAHARRACGSTRRRAQARQPPGKSRR